MPKTKQEQQHYLNEYRKNRYHTDEEYCNKIKANTKVYHFSHKDERLIKQRQYRIERCQNNMTLRAYKKKPKVITVKEGTFTLCFD